MGVGEEKNLTQRPRGRKGKNIYPEMDESHKKGRIDSIEDSLTVLVQRIEGKSGGELATDVGANVVDGAEVLQVIVVHVDLNDVFNQHYDFEHGQGIHSEVIKDADIIPFLLEEGTCFRLEKALDDSGDD